MRYMRKAVLSESHSHERTIRFFNVDADRLIVFYIFKFYFQTTISLSFSIFIIKNTITGVTKIWRSAIFKFYFQIIISFLQISYPS